MKRRDLFLTDLGVDSDLEQSYVMTPENFVKRDVQITNDGVSVSKCDERPSSLSPKDIQVQRFLGDGFSSKVYLVKHKTLGNIALKEISVMDKQKREQLVQEIKALYTARCPCLVKFYGAFYVDTKVKIGIEYMDQGCLGTVLQKFGKLPERMVAAVTLQVVWGLGWLLHAQRVHRDIKPQNILCDSSGQVKLTDFGVSKELDGSIMCCKTLVGTYVYMSPERVSMQNYDFPSDIWSLGLVLVQCLSGRFPYSTIPIEFYQQLKDAPEPQAPNSCTSQCHAFISMCLQKEPSKRASVQQLISSDWLNLFGATSVEGSQQIVAEFLRSSS